MATDLFAHCSFSLPSVVAFEFRRLSRYREARPAGVVAVMPCKNGQETKPTRLVVFRGSV